MNNNKNIEKQLRELGVDEDELMELSQELCDLAQNCDFSVINHIEKLSDDEINSISVTKYNIFSDDSWLLDIPSGYEHLNFYVGLPKGIVDYSKCNDDLRFFYKTLMYYQFPDNDMDGTKNSCVTTKYMYSSYKLLIKYLFIDNTLYNPAYDCWNITVHQVLGMFNKAKTSGFTSHYSSVFRAFKNYLRLCALDVLPDKYQLKFSINDIDTDRILKDIISHEAKNSSTYYPLNENELELIVDYIFEANSTYSKEFVELYDEFIDQGYTRSHYISLDDGFSTRLVDYKFSSEKNKDGQPWFEFEIDESNNRVVVSNFNFSVRKDIIASSIIAICLLTGLRRKEVAALKTDCCIKLNDGTYQLTFTRFKTSADPHKGKVEKIPVPETVFTAVNYLKTLYREGRDSSGSEYLFAPKYVEYSEESNKKNRQYLQSSKLALLVRDFGLQLGIERLHLHRLRKTIAWLLISKSEKNIELVRHLLGHSSYAMTLKYILRNHEMVDEVIHLFENHFTDELSGLMQDVFNKNYSGQAADSLSEIIESKPEMFKAEVLHATIEDFIASLNESGEEIFFNRIPIGGYCVVSELTPESITPCMRVLDDGTIEEPDPQMCDWQKCDRKILVKTALPILKRDVIYYKKMLKFDGTTERVRKQYEKTIEVYSIEIEKLSNPDNSPTPEYKNNKVVS